MKILFIGEIVARPGREIVRQILPEILKENDIDAVFANAENLSGGKGIAKHNVEEMHKVGIDYFTGGDHTFDIKDTLDYIDELPVLRPANLPEGTPGEGYAVIDTVSKGKVLLVNLMGNLMGNTPAYLENPFLYMDDLLKKFDKKDFKAIILDFHAEATSEKYSLGHYLDGRVTAMVGTNTHVPTCDNMVLPKGTLYVSDLGMCGAIDSSLGVDVDITIKMFTTGMKQRFEWENTGRKAFRSVLLDTEAKTIIRIDKLI